MQKLVNLGKYKTFFYYDFLHFFHSKLQVEVIGGADMYMATCRSCFFAPGVVPASPRIPLKTMNNGTKENVQVETNNLDKDDIIPYKKALFDTEQAIENAM